MSEKNRHNQRQGQHGPMGGMGAPVEKAKDFKGSFKRLLAYLKPHKLNLIIVLIFAIASTTFTILAPKITSRATNQLQDAYMARKMVSEMSKGQNDAVTQMNDKMGDIQTEVNDKIISKMADGQKEAVDKITTNMGDAQEKAVDKIYESIAKQMYQGVEKGQIKAVDQVTSQMASVQKKMVSQLKTSMKQLEQMQQAGEQLQQAIQAIQAQLANASQLPPQQVQMLQAKQTELLKQAEQMKKASSQMPDEKTIAAMKKLVNLPLISSMSDRQKKIDTTLKFIDILGDLPANKKIDKKQLSQVKNLLSIPMLGSVPNGTEKVNVVKKFMDLSKTMSGSSKSESSSFDLDTDSMNKVYDKMKKMTDFSTDSSSTSDKKMDTKAKNAVEKLLKLPFINEIQDSKEKTKTLNQLLDIFADMPDMSNSSSDNSDTKVSKSELKTIKDLIALPDIGSITDQKEKYAATIKAVDVFSKMSDMDDKDNADSNKTVDPDQLNSIKELLGLPLLNTVTNPDEKLNVVKQMLTVFGDMPDMDSTTDTGSENKIDSKSIKSVQKFLDLPKLDTLTDANQKADVARQIIDLGKEMKDTMQNAPDDPKNNVKFTDSQIDSAIKSIRETNGEYDFVYIGQIAIILIIMYVISSVFSLIMGLVMSGVAQRTVRDLRREVDEKLARLPLSYFDRNAHGDILSRVTNDVDTISTTLQQSLTQIITSVITIIGYIIMMLSISSVLTLIVIATLPLYVLSTVVIAKKSQKYFGSQQKEIGLISGHVEEIYTGHKIVKAFGHEKDAIHEFEDINNRLNVAGWKAQFVSGIMFPLMNFISNIGYVGISIVGGLWITKSLLGLGDILAFIQYSRSFTMPIVQTANIANVIQSTIACAERVFEILDEEEELPDSSDAIVLENPSGNVTFEQVDFRYVEEVPLIEDMNLDVKQGNTIAIVGPTGAGKTTLVNLLMRFYEINAGTIEVDGVNINHIKRNELRKMFGMVLQDTWLFNGTIKENIAYGKEDATMEDIVRAAKAAHADRFIRTLPEGYDTVLNEEGTNISQGQKQLLTIARAILADPAILILDEATSSVDTRTEVLIQKAMVNLMKNRTSFVIAHRLSTIRDAEMILVMNQGSIIEMGNHKELISQGGFYADLYNSQFSGAMEEAM